MELFKRAYAWAKERYAKLGIFGNTFGISFAFVILAIGFGTPAAAHAGIISDAIDWISDNTLGFVFKVIAYLILSFSDLILYIVGWLFDLVVNYTVFGFGKYFSVSQGLIDAWGVLRDIANIALIFGFVMIGVATMLDIHGYEVKKTLPRLIIFAVLLNFSLLASEAIIDTSNVFASVLYSESGAGGTCSGAKVGEGGDACGTTSISGKILSMGGVFSIFDTEGGASGTLSSDGSGAPVTKNDVTTAGQSAFASNTQKGMVYLGLAIFVTIAAVVLLAGAIMLIIRAVILTFLMVLSPVGFAGLAVPPLERYAQMWWDKLLSQSFFAPLYLLLILISLKIGQGIQTGLGTGANFEHALMADAASGDSIIIILIFALMIGFMVASLMIAKQMGAMGADFAISAGRKVVSYPFALANRHGVAPVSNRAGRWYNEKIGKWSSEEHGTTFSRGLASTLRATGIDEGLAATFSAARKAKVGGFASQEERQKQLSARKNESMHAAEISELRDAITEAMAKGSDEGAQKAAQALAQKMNGHGLEEAIKTMSDAQVEKLGEVLSPDKFQEAMKNKDIGADKQHLMQHGRFGKFESDDATVLAKFKDLTKEDQEQFAQSFGERFDKLLKKQREGEKIFKEDQLDVLKDSKKLTAAQRAEVKQSSLVGRVDAGEDAAIHEMTDKQKAKLKPETLVRLGNTLSYNDLAAIAANTNLKESERREIMAKVDMTDEMLASFDKNQLLASQWGVKSQGQIDVLRQILAALGGGSRPSTGTTASGPTITT
jgi:hypothetical protein